MGATERILILNSALTMLSVSTPEAHTRHESGVSDRLGQTNRVDARAYRWLSKMPGGHRCVTQFRNREDTGGSERTRRARRLSTGGHARNRRDTEGHTVVPVRDREAPGSNPGPPTKNRIQIEVFGCSVWHAGVTGRSQIFLELCGGSPVQVDFEASIELAHGYR